MGTDAARNDLESYVYNMRDKTSEAGQYGQFITAADRETFHSELMKAEDWLYDHEDGTKVMFIEKLSELQKFGEPAAQRFKAMEAREDYYPEVLKTITHYRILAESPDEKYSHIASEKKKQILAECSQVEGWLNMKKQEQQNNPLYQDPVLTVPMMQQKQEDISAMADKMEDQPSDTAADPPAATEKTDPKQEEVDAAL